MRGQISRIIVLLNSVEAMYSINEYWREQAILPKMNQIYMIHWGG